MIRSTQTVQSLFSSLDDLLNRQHPLYKLSHKIDWKRFEEAFSPLYCQDNGRPGKPIRLMYGLLILKHLRNISDESVVEQWSENAYFQYFCGMREFTPSFPCNASEPVYFRKRIGEKGIELIPAESIRVNYDKNDKDHHDTVFIDATIQEKNVTYPTDAKLHKKIVGKVLKIARNINLPIRQSYTFVLKRIYRDQRFHNHPKNRKKAIKADKRLRTIAGVWLENLNETWAVTGSMTKSFPSSKRFFCNAVIRLGRFILFMNRLFKASYRGKQEINGTQILIPEAPKAKDCYYQRKKKHRLFYKRAAIEPTIGHLKSDCRLGRNFYKGVFEDAINVMLAAAAYNFKRAMKDLQHSLKESAKHS